MLAGQKFLVRFYWKQVEKLELTWTYSLKKVHLVKQKTTKKIGKVRSHIKFRPHSASLLAELTAKWGEDRKFQGIPYCLKKIWCIHLSNQFKTITAKFFSNNFWAGCVEADETYAFGNKYHVWSLDFLARICWSNLKSLWSVTNTGKQKRQKLSKKTNN